VIAEGNEPARRHVVRGSRTELHVHALDLELLPEDLLRQVTAVAAAICDTLSAARHVELSAHIG
jgi:hypothetical protein